MALVKATLKAQIESAVKAIDLLDETTDVPAVIANILADAIDAYIKTATVTVTVATTGTAVAQTGTGTGTLS